MLTIKAFLKYQIFLKHIGDEDAVIQKIPGLLEEAIIKEDFVIPMAVGTQLRLTVIYDPTIDAVTTDCKLSFEFDFGSQLYKTTFYINELYLDQNQNMGGVACSESIDNLVTGANTLQIVASNDKFEVYINGVLYQSCVSTARLQEFNQISMSTGNKNCFSPIADTIQLVHKLNKGYYT